ncbi:MAG: sulfite exporter TauE/SafE family protein [Actinomycetota bacterium]|nr:MAG: sulfite exporter TauE/SafE family protein [Actinomycetota bacterium]
MPDVNLVMTLGGLIAGVVVGLTGLGGAAIVTPMLMLVFGVPSATAVSTDVVTAAITKPVGSIVHLRRRTPYLPVVGWLTLGSVPGVLVGTWFFARIAGDSHGNDTLRRLVGITLVVAVVVSLSRGAIGRRAAAVEATDTLPASAGRNLLTGLIGLVVGLIVGVTSVGSGTLIAASLLLIYPMMRASRLVGTDLVQAVPMLAAGAIAHAGIGGVDLGIVISLLLGQIPGVWLGARISSRYDGQELRWLLLAIVGSSAIALLGAPAWLATTVSIVSIASLGSLVLVRALRHRRHPAGTSADSPGQASAGRRH